MSGLPKPVYVMSEPHLSGYRVILGYETLADAQAAQLALSKPQAREDAQPVHAFAERVFKAGHADGWSGNQTRRAAAHADAQEGWERYVRNGALGKSLAAVNFHPAHDALRVAVEALTVAKSQAERGADKAGCDGWRAQEMCREIVPLIAKALAALQAEQGAK